MPWFPWYQPDPGYTQELPEDEAPWPDEGPAPLGPRPGLDGLVGARVRHIGKSFRRGQVGRVRSVFGPHSDPKRLRFPEPEMCWVEFSDGSRHPCLVADLKVLDE
jgi:hypothetical protein